MSPATSDDDDALVVRDGGAVGEEAAPALFGSNGFQAGDEGCVLADGERVDVDVLKHGEDPRGVAPPPGPDNFVTEI